MAEIAALGDVNPAVQKRLLEELRQSDPALWPLLTKQIRATLAYQQQQAAKAAGRSEANSAPGKVPAVVEAKSSGMPPSQPLAKSPPESTSPAAKPVAEATAAASPASAPQGQASAQNAAASPASAEKGAVEQVAYEQPIAPTDHDALLAQAIKALEAQSSGASRDDEAVARQARLRMLYLAAGRREDALRPIPGATAAQQDYWSKQFYALSTYLDSQRIADHGRRAAEAVSHLTDAAACLSEQGPLVVKNLNFCSEVSSFGVYKQIERHEFKSGQQVLIYAEVEHFKSEETREGFHTALQTSYQILDAQGRRVAHDDFPLTEEHCQNRRRDYFVRYFLTLPAQIYEGQYTLELTIEDTLARKIGQSTIQFTIAGKSK